jgi:hypothetical protein
VTKSTEQATVERVRKRLKRDPARMARMRVQWNMIAGLLAGHVAHSPKKWKSYEFHHLTEKTRTVMMSMIDAGTVLDQHLWIYTMHTVGYPAAPHPKSKPAHVQV